MEVIQQLVITAGLLHALLGLVCLLEHGVGKGRGLAMAKVILTHLKPFA